jgi:hypothetical protein
MPDPLVVVFTTAGRGPAGIIQEMLIAAGIPATTSQEGAGAAYGFTVGPLGTVEILVPAPYEADARRLLEAMERGELNGDGGGTSPPSPPP